MNDRSYEDGLSYEEGLKIRREVLGEAHVERATAEATDFDRDFQRWITKNAWGEVWTRPHLDLRTKSLLTIAILAALGREELSLHVEASRNTGVTPEDVAEALLHVGVYAGVPAANQAFKIAKRVLSEARPDPDGDDGG